MAVSNSITAILNFIIFLSSIPVIAAGIWLASKPDNECIQLLRWPVVVLGGLLLLVSLLGFVGAYWNRPGLLAVYLFFMAVLIILLLIVLIIAFTATRPEGATHPVAGTRFQEYSLDGYSSWLRRHVTSSGSWPSVRTCLAVSDVCRQLNREFSTAEQFYAADISPLQVAASRRRRADTSTRTRRHGRTRRTRRPTRIACYGATRGVDSATSAAAARRGCSKTSGRSGGRPAPFSSRRWWFWFSCIWWRAPLTRMRKSRISLFGFDPTWTWGEWLTWPEAESTHSTLGLSSPFSYDLVNKEREHSVSNKKALIGEALGYPTLLIWKESDRRVHLLI